MSTPDPGGVDGPLRQELYAAMNDSSLSLDEKLEHALETGRKYLDVENGHIERVEDGDGHQVVATVGESLGTFAPGVVLEEATTYCRRTVDRDTPLALSNASEQGWANDPAYVKHDLECYLGTTLFVEGEVYGAVCFVSRESRPDEFTDAQLMFVELLARLVGRALESERHAEAVETHQRAQEQTESKYEALVQAAPEALFVANVETGETVEVNEQAVALVGYDRETLVGMDQRRLQPPEQREQYSAEYERIFDADGPVDRFSDGTPLYYQHRDGTRIPVEISASPVEIDGEQCVQGLVRDISDRREREAELRVKNRAIDDAAVGITIASTARDDLPLVYANDGFEEVSGYDAESVVGRNCRFLQGPGTDPETVRTIREAIEDEQTTTTELVNYRADATPFWNRLTLTPVEDRTGEVTHFVGIQQDVTVEKRRQRLVALLNRILRHNLRNDMNVVKGFAELIGDRHEGETAEMSRRIADVAGRLTRLGEKAQTIEKTVQENGTPRERDVGSLFETVTADLTGDYPDATVETVEQADRNVLVTDPFETALRELGTNACEHAGESPTVAFEVRSGESDDWVEVVVSDDGPGLPDNERHVLETGEESPLYHGSGIGLWLVNWIVTGLGGTVTVDADHDGLSVVLRVPSASGDADAVRTSRQVAIGVSQFDDD